MAIMLAAQMLLLLTALIWGSTFVATKICLKYMSPLELMAFRFAIGLPVLLILLVARRASLSVGRNWKAIILAAIVIGAHFIIQITGIKYTTATNTGWIISLTPLVVTVMAAAILRERIGVKTVVGIGVASTGIILLISRGQIANLRWMSSVGDWLVLASAHTWALYTILTRDLSRSQNPLSVTFLVLLPSAIMAVAIVLPTSDLGRFAALPAEAVVSLLVLGVLGTALGHWFWQHGLAKVGAARAGVFLYLEPVATTAVAVPYLHESFGIFTAIGGLLVLAGVWIAQRK